MKKIKYEEKFKGSYPSLRFYLSHIESNLRHIVTFAGYGSEDIDRPDLVKFYLDRVLAKTDILRRVFDPDSDLDLTSPEFEDLFNPFDDASS